MFYTRGIFNDLAAKKMMEIYNKKTEVVEESFKKDDFVVHKETGRVGKVKSITGDKTHAEIQWNGDHEVHQREEHPVEKLKKFKESVDDVEELEEGSRVEYKTVGNQQYKRVDKGTWMPVSKRTEVKKVGNDVLVRKDKGTWKPHKGASFHEEVEVTEGFGVYRKGGSIGEKHNTPHGTLVKVHDNENDAKDHASRMNRNTSPGDKKYYGIKYHVKPIKEEVEIVEENIEQLDEVTIDHSRYVRSHGKKPRSSGNTSWMYTSKPMGEVDYNNPKEFHQTKHGEDHKKSAKEWAKKNGHHRIYTMESMELDDSNLESVEEISKKTLGSYVKKAALDIDSKASSAERMAASDLDDDTIPEYSKKLGKIDKRHAGISKAVNKLTKEEIEMIESALEAMNSSEETK